MNISYCSLTCQYNALRTHVYMCRWKNGSSLITRHRFYISLETLDIHKLDICTNWLLGCGNKHIISISRPAIEAIEFQLISILPKVHL